MPQVAVGKRGRGESLACHVPVSRVVNSWARCSGSEWEPAPERTPAEAAALESLVPLDITSVT